VLTLIEAPDEFGSDRDVGRIAQSPASELAGLRIAKLSSLPPSRLALPPLGTSAPVFLLRGGNRSGRMLCRPGVSCVRGAGDALDCSIRFERGASAAVGLWRPPATPGGAGLLVVWCWRAEELYVSHEGLAAAAADAAMAASASCCPYSPNALPPSHPGPAREAAVEMRVFFDGSVVEAFTMKGGVCAGRALATRAYRGSSAPGGVHLVALGGEAAVVGAECWALGSIWEE
jgi:hypothetical protein